MSDPTREMDGVPADLRAIDARVARLAEVDTAGAPDGMDERVFEATRAIIARGARPQPRLRLAGSVREAAPVSLRSAGRLFTPMRVAAVVGILGAAGAVRLAMVAPAPAPTGEVAALLETEIDSMLGASDFLDDGLGDLAQRIDLIFADMVTMDNPAQAEEDWTEGGAM